MKPLKDSHIQLEYLPDTNDYPPGSHYDFVYDALQMDNHPPGHCQPPQNLFAVYKAFLTD
jgi:hypothetical protein